MIRHNWNLNYIPNIDFDKQFLQYFSELSLSNFFNQNVRVAAVVSHFIIKNIFNKAHLNSTLVESKLFLRHGHLEETRWDVRIETQLRR